MSARGVNDVIYSTLRDRGVSADRAAQITVVLQSALSAAGWVVEQGWQPIETAPQDRDPDDGNDVIDIWVEDDGRGWRLADAYWDSTDELWVSWNRHGPGAPQCKAKFWRRLSRPLPDAPQEDRDDGR